MTATPSNRLARPDGEDQRRQAGLSRRSLIRAASAALTLPAPRGLAAPPRADWQTIDPSGAQLLTMHVSTDDRDVRAAIDTASSRTVIETSLATALGLTSRGEASATGLAGAIRGSWVTIPRVRLGDLKFDEVEAQSYDLSELALDADVQLVVGQDLLSQCLLELQFSRSRFRLGSHEGLRPTSTSGSIVVTRSPRRLPLLATSVEGGPETTAILDLGSTVVCSMSRRFAEDRGLLGDRQVSTTLTIGAEGATENLVLTARSVSLGPYVLREVPVCVIDDWQRSSQIDLGWPFFRAFDMLLDLGRDRLLLSTDPARLATPLPKDRAGIGASRMPDRFLVRHVSKGSPAERAGLHPGDEIVAFDGRAIDSAWPPRGERQGLRGTGTPLELDLADGRRIELVLADYF